MWDLTPIVPKMPAERWDEFGTHGQRWEGKSFQPVDVHLEVRDL